MCNNGFNKGKVKHVHIVEKIIKIFPAKIYPNKKNKYYNIFKKVLII